MHVYKSTNFGPFTVGHYEPNGKWYPVSDHKDEKEAAERTHYLNGGNTPHAPEQNELLVEAIDLIPRVSDNDPMSPALREWVERARCVVENEKLRNVHMGVV